MESSIEGRVGRSTDIKNGGRLTGIASGQVTLTATAGTTSAQENVNVLAAAAYSPGTVIWSNAPAPGFVATQLAQAVPTDQGPDLYSTQLSSDGSQSIVQALTADGQQIWQTTLPPISNNSVPDGFGGLIVMEYDTCNPRQTNPLTLVDLDPTNGQPDWQMSAAGIQQGNGILYCYQPGTASPQIAVRGDGTLIISAPTNNGFPQLTVVPIGGGFTVSPPIRPTVITDSLGNQSAVQCCMGPPMVNSDGTSYVESEARNINQNGIITSDTLYLWQINADNSYSSTTLSTTTQNEALLPGPIISDGQGGVIATWTISASSPPLPQFPYQAVDIVSGVLGAPFNLPFNPQTVTVGQSPSLVLGDNSVVFASGLTTSTDGNDTPLQQIVSFTLGSTVPNWSYQASGGNSLSIIAATQGGGLVAKNTDSSGKDTILTFDSAGNATPDVLIAPRTGKLLGIVTNNFDTSTSLSGVLSNVSYLANGIWVGSTGTSIAGVAGNSMEAALNTYPFDKGNSFFQSSSTPVIDHKANDAVHAIFNKAFWTKFKGSHCASVFNKGLSIQTQFALRPYSLTDAMTKINRMTNFYDLGDPGAGNLTRRQVTAGEDANDQTLSDRIQKANAFTTQNLGMSSRFTAVVLQSGLLAGPNQQFPLKPEYTLTHEVMLHAYAAQSDSDIFAIDTFMSNGLLNTSPSSSTNISTWMSTDCKCTPNVSTGACSINSAPW